MRFIIVEDVKMKNFYDVQKAGISFCQQHGFKIERANLAHDACHTVSGFPPTVEGEELQVGWELAIMFADKYKKLNNLNNLKIQGFCDGVEFRESQPELAKLLCDALTSREFDENFQISA
jgi:hypothetical protein